MKLLIVDDSLIVRSVIERNVQHAAIQEIFQADNGITALQLYTAHQPQLITMDLTMPHLDGLACLREIQHLGHSPSILVISALNSHRTAMDAVAQGACGFLVKPFTVPELVDAIDQLVQHAQTQESHDPSLHEILLIHDHPIAGEMILSFIRAHKPLCRVLLVDHPEKALVHLKEEPVHLVIANLQAVPSKESFAFLAMLNGWNPPIPIIAIDESIPEDIPLVAGGITVLPPPTDFEVLLELIDTMTLAAQESVLNGISLKVFLQMLELERKTCTLRIISGYQMGHLHLRDGRLVAARSGPLKDQEAVTTILDWPNCTITISESANIKETMDATIQTVLMEWCIYRDEKTPPPSKLQNA